MLQMPHPGVYLLNTGPKSAAVSPPAGHGAVHKEREIHYPTAMSEPTLLSAYQRIHLRLRRLATQLLGSTDEAEDVLQDAFCKLWVKPTASDKPPHEAEALLTTTVRHLSIDHLRERERRPQVSLDEGRDAGPADPEGETQRREERFRQLESAVEQCLTPLQRDILHRHEYRGEDFGSIAQSLHMQPAAVRMQLSRARQTIRNYFKTQTP